MGAKRWHENSDGNIMSRYGTIATVIFILLALICFFAGSNYGETSSYREMLQKLSKTTPWKENRFYNFGDFVLYHNTIFVYEYHNWVPLYAPEPPPENDKLWVKVLSLDTIRSD